MSILLLFAAFCVSLAVLIKSSDYFTNSAEKLGYFFNLPPFIIGVTIVAIGTSLPELASSLAAVFSNKTEIVVADESGELQIYNTKSSKHIKTLSGQNLDNVFAVDYKNEIIATAGQDRRVVVYNMNYNSAYYKTSNFLIYSVGLSPSGKFVAYASDENNNVTVFKKNTKSKNAISAIEEELISCKSRLFGFSIIFIYSFHLIFNDFSHPNTYNLSSC